MTETVQTESLGFSYAGLNGFRDVSFTASAGEVSCIFGLNGSGKSTLAFAVCNRSCRKNGHALRTHPPGKLRGDPERDSRGRLSTLLGSTA